MIKGFYSVPKDINLKVNVIVQVKFEVPYFESPIHFFYPLQ